jgi:hypothetical protein
MLHILPCSIFLQSLKGLENTPHPVPSIFEFVFSQSPPLIFAPSYCAKDV